MGTTACCPGWGCAVVNQNEQRPPAKDGRYTCFTSYRNASVRGHAPGMGLSWIQVELVEKAGEQWFRCLEHHERLDPRATRWIAVPATVRRNNAATFAEWQRDTTAFWEKRKEQQHKTFVQGPMPRIGGKR